MESWKTPEGEMSSEANNISKTISVSPNLAEIVAIADINC